MRRLLALWLAMIALFAAPALADPIGTPGGASIDLTTHQIEELQDVTATSGTATTIVTAVGPFLDGTCAIWTGGDLLSATCPVADGLGTNRDAGDATIGGTAPNQTITIDAGAVDTTKLAVKSGTATTVVTGTGPFTPGCSEYDASGNLITTGAPCLTSDATSAAEIAEGMTLCRTGLIPGGGYDASTGLYDWWCGGTYNASSILGGTIAAGSGRVASWVTPTTVGGNGYYIDCTAPGVGVGQDGAALNVATNLALAGGTFSGSGTTSLPDSGAGYATNALRGYLVVATSGSASGQQRYITANDGNSITVGTAFTASVASGNTYEVYNPIAGVCYAAGERVKINFMADAMIGNEMVRKGGKVLFPNFSDHQSGIYVHTGCGRKGFGAGTVTPVFNSCPVLRGVNNGHYQRYVDMGTADKEWIFEGTDRNLFARDGTGRENVYVVEDTGGYGAANHYYDPADGYDMGQGGQTWQFRIGGSGMFPNQCIPISATDSRCDVTQTTAFWQQGYSVVRDARSFTSGVASHTTDVVDPTAICVTDQVGVSTLGVCEDDPRLECTVAGDGQARTSATAGGCDFGAGGDKGTCESLADTLKDWTETRPDRTSNWLMIAQGIQNFPGTTFNSGIQGYFSRIASVPGASCAAGVGATVSTGLTTAQGGQGGDSWILPVGNFDTSSSPTLGWLTDDYQSPLGGVRGGTWMPNNWYGRDADDDSVSDIGIDCLSGGTTSGTDDEATCESKAVLSPYFIRGGGLRDAVIAYGSVSGGNAASWVDGSSSQWQTRIEDTLITKGKRGAVGDWSNLSVKNVTVEDNVSENLIVNSGFSSLSEYEYLTFRQNTAISILNLGFGRNTSYRHLRFEGNDSFVGQMVIANNVSDVLLEDIRCIGGDYPCLVLHNAFAGTTTANVTVNGIRGIGLPSSAYGNGHVTSIRALSLIDVDQAAVSCATGSFRNINISDARMESSVNNAILVAFDKDPTANCNINTQRGQFSIRDSAIHNVNGATGAKAIAVGSHLGTFFQAGADTGIFAERYMPQWQNVSVDGLKMIDHTQYGRTAAQAGNANAVPHGTMVEITNDTAVGACTDATSDGVLDGGGTYVSTCLSNGILWNVF